MANRGPSVIALNVSHLFNREILMYSFGDIKLKKPIPLKKIAWTFAALMVWSAPIVYIFGMGIPIWSWIFVLGPPILFGNYVTKPIFGDKGLIDWVKTQVSYIQQPRGWSDLKIDNDQEDTVYYISHEISISRRREIAYLARLAQQRAVERDEAAQKDNA